MTTVSAPAAAKAVHDAGLSGEVSVTGITLPSAIGEYVRNGTVNKFVLWDPRAFGYMTVHVARLALDGAIPPGATRIEIGKLGELAVEGQEIILGAPLVFERSTIDAYDF
jgi:ABC-type sugar transport system substrate-binding protein